MGTGEYRSLADLRKDLVERIEAFPGGKYKLAAKLKCDPKTIYNFINQAGDSSLKTIEKLCEFFNLPHPVTGALRVSLGPAALSHRDEKAPVVELTGRDVIIVQALRNSDELDAINEVIQRWRERDPLAQRNEDYRALSAIMRIIQDRKNLKDRLASLATQ